MAAPLKLCVALILTAAAVLVTHWPVMHAGALSFDDNEYLVDNRVVQNPSLAHAGKFLTEVLAPSTVRGYYQPLAMISLMVDCWRGGSPTNLRPFHETSLALHVANTCLVVVVLWLLFGKLEVAAAVGLIFGLHPMTVEPIAWVGDRKTTLAAFFALWSVLLYILHARKRSPWIYGLCLVAFALSLMSKPTTTCLPGALLVMDFWPLRRLSWRTVVGQIPLAILSLASAIVTVVSQGRTGVVGMPTGGSGLAILTGFCHNVIFYLGKMVWPVHLTPLYPKPDDMSLANPTIVAMVVATFLLAAAVLVSLRWTRAVLSGSLIFLCIILPTMSGVAFTAMIASDKYVYLPVLGLLIILCWLAIAGFQWLQAAHGAGLARVGLWSAVACIVVLEFIGVRRYLPRWHDTLNFELYMAEMAPKSPIIHYNLGLTYGAAGQTDQAIARFTQALALDPSHAGAHTNLANTLVTISQFEGAVDHYRRAIQIDPDRTEAREGLANVLAMRGRYDEAIAEYEAILAAQRDSPGTQRNYGVALILAGKPEAAVDHLKRALAGGQNDARVHYRLGQALAATGQSSEALDHLRTAAQLAPDWPAPLQEAQRIAAGLPASSRPQ